MKNEFKTAIFVVALSEYDQNLFEDRNKNRLEEAFEMFTELANSDLLRNSTILLYLNKSDLFTEKFLVKKIPLNISNKFPTAPKDNDDIRVATDWIVSEFVSRRKVQANKDPGMWVYLVTATNSENTKEVFDKSKGIILKNSLSTGFL